MKYAAIVMTMNKSFNLETHDQYLKGTEENIQVLTVIFAVIIS